MRQIATLQELTSSSGGASGVSVTEVYVSGRSSYNDGFQGVFYWDPSITLPDADDGTIIFASTVGSGGWRRQYSGQINVKWFGAVGDGVTDDTQAISLAVAATQANHNLHFPPGTYIVSSTIELTNSITITGCGKSTTIRQTSQLLDCILINPLTNNMTFKIFSITIRGGLNGVHLTGTGALGSHYLSRDSSMRELFIYGQSYSGIYVETGLIGTYHECLNIESSGQFGIYTWTPDPLGVTTWVSVRVAGTTQHGIHIRNSDTKYPAPSTSLNDQSSVVFVNPIFEGNLGAGIYIFSSHVTLVGGHFEANGISGSDVYTTADVIIDTNYTIEDGVNFSHVRMLGTYFSTSSENQGGLRIQLLNNGCRLALYFTRILGSNIIDGGNISAASSILVDDPISVPIIQNFSGHIRINLTKSAETYSPSGLGESRYRSIAADNPAITAQDVAKVLATLITDMRDYKLLN